MNAINPAHYQKGGVECIEAIEASMTAEAFKGFLKGNCIKYLYRYENKNGIEDLKKAEWYLLRLTALIENEVAFENKITQAISDALSVNYDPDDHLKSSGCPDGFVYYQECVKGPQRACSILYATTTPHINCSKGRGRKRLLFHAMAKYAEWPRTMLPSQTDQCGHLQSYGNESN